MCMNIIQFFSGSSVFFNFLLVPQLVLACEIITLIFTSMPKKTLILPMWKESPEERLTCLLVHTAQIPICHLVSVRIDVGGHLLRLQETFKLTWNAKVIGNLKHILPRSFNCFYNKVSRLECENPESTWIISTLMWWAENLV